MKLREMFPTHMERSEGSLLQVTVFGSPEVLFDGSPLTFSLRKAQALLLYLAVEKGLHSRNKLIGLLWPDSEPQTARSAFRNALALLHSLLNAPSIADSPLISRQDALGLNPEFPVELDLDVVQHAWKEVLPLTTAPAESQRTVLVAQVQHALSLAHGPLLDGFWLREEAPFDRWVQQQQQQWQLRLQLLCDRLSNWQIAAGELGQAGATLTRWLAFDPLAEEPYRRLMQVHLAQGDATAALQVYATCRTHLAEELHIEPSADTITLAERARTISTKRSQIRPTYLPGASPADNLVAPLIGRTSAFTRLVSCYQQVQAGQPQAALLVGEAGIGKTRLASEFFAWARAQGAEVLHAQAFELGGQLPYQPIVAALRTRLEAENAPEDLLDDLWLSELSRLLPELRQRYPDLSAPIQDSLLDTLRLCEAVARLFDALARNVPLILLLDDLHWLDAASFNLVRYLAHSWKDQGSRVFLLCTVRSDQLELNPTLAAWLADLRRDLPLMHIELPALSKQETLQFVESIVGSGKQSLKNEGKMQTRHIVEATSAAAAGWGTRLKALGNFLFAWTGGQPLYLLETLKLFRDRQWLVPHLGEDGSGWLEPAAEISTVVAKKQAGCELVPPSVRALVLTRLSRLTQSAKQLVMTTAVLGSQVSAQVLWQVAELSVQAGIEALEEAVKSGLLSEVDAVGAGTDLPGKYGFSHELMREVIYTELGSARRQVIHQRALALLQVREVKTSGQTNKAGSDVQALLSPLTKRELEVLHLIAQGASNQEIADRLVLSLQTVKRHVSNTLGKLQASNRTGAVTYARSLGLLSDEHVGRKVPAFKPKETTRIAFSIV